MDFKERRKNKKESKDLEILMGYGLLAFAVFWAFILIKVPDWVGMILIILLLFTGFKLYLYRRQ